MLCEVTNVETGATVKATLQPFPDDYVDKSPADTADLLCAVQIAQMAGRMLRNCYHAGRIDSAMVVRYIRFVVYRGLSFQDGMWSAEDCRYLLAEGLAAAVML
jgi:hypothetical protein